MPDKCADLLLPSGQGSTGERVQQAKITQPLTFAGRTFSVEELQLIQEISRDYQSLGRTETSRTLCELLEWKRPNGRLKNHECRLLLERLQELGAVRLPEIRPLGRRGPRSVELTPQSEPGQEIAGSAGEFEPLQLEVVEG